MDLKTRRILYITFIILFFTITPIISLYASGYKLGSGFKVQKTGILILDTEPRNAKIFLNGKLQESFIKNIFNPEKNYIKTPAKLKDILPGEYEVKIELENYWTWQKKLVIKSGQSTYAENISLFKKTIPLQLFSGKIEELQFSPDKKDFIISNQDKAILYNIQNETIVFEKDFLKNSPRASSSRDEWLSDNYFLIDKVLFERNSQKPIINFNESISKNIKNFKTDQSNSDVVYYDTDSAISSYNIATKENTTIINDVNVIDFLPKNDYLFFIKNNFNATDLISLKLSDNTSQKTILQNSTYSFLHPEQELINLYDYNRQTLFLLDPLSSFKSLKQTINNLNKSEWVNNEKFLFANDFEIWTMNMKSGEITLVTRISEKIQKIITPPNDNYIIYATEKTINVIELDNRDRYNITKLIEMDEIKFPFLNKEGETLYFYGRMNNNEGLYKLFIQ